MLSIMQRGGWTTDHVMKTVYRHTLADRTESMNQKVNHLVGEVMQHEVSHEKQKAQCLLDFLAAGGGT